MRTINSIELRALLSEITKRISDSKVSKIYHPSHDEIFLEFHKSGENIPLTMILGKALYITKYKKDMPKAPSHFCMFLRKYLINSRLESVSQIGSERIIEFVFQKEKKYRLIIELFSRGNAVLCEEDYTIIIPLNVLKFESRQIIYKEKYKLPPSVGENPFLLKKEDLERVLSQTEKSDVVRCIASDLTIGSMYAEEILFRAGVKKETEVKELKKSEIEKIYKELIKIIGEIAESKVSPEVVFLDNELFDFAPFKIKAHEYLDTREFDSMNECLDFIYTGWQEEQKKQQKIKIYEEKLKELTSRLGLQKKLMLSAQEDIEKYRKKGNLVMNNFSTIEPIIEKILNERKKGVSWEKIKSILSAEKQKGVPEALMIKEIKENEGIILFDLNEEFELDFTKSLTGLADRFYSESKKLKRKTESAESARKETENRIQDLESKKESLIEVESSKEIENKKKEWFQKFSYFFTSKGNLFIAGKSAVENEILIKKYIESTDIVFHADIYGSPFGILKNGKKADEKELNECAVFIASHSRAWRQNIPVDVYYVEKEQVSKTAPSGEYLGYGSFTISGKKNYIRNVSPSLAFAVKDTEIISAPLSAVEKHSDNFFIILPGEEKTSDIAKELIKKLNSKSKVDDVVRMIPSGGSKISKK